jgi:murein DD-endopeptidase MepM/ murein hydrolase activator NlpD
VKRVLFVVLFLCLAVPAYAQEPTPVPDASRRSPPGDAGPAPVIYVVQPGDTLYRIAQDYGTTVEAIVAANDIADPAQIAVGQKLIIPTALVAPEPPVPPPTSPNRRVHPVRPGEILPSLAFRYGTTVTALREANGLHRLGLLTTGQELIIPPPAVSTLEDHRFPPISIRPAPVVQGQTVFVSVQSDDSLELSGSLSDRPLSFVREDEQYWALLGLDALTPPGAYPLDLLAVEASTGDRITMQKTLTVTAGAFPTYNIVVPASRQNLLDPELSRAEREKVAQVFAGVSPRRLFVAPFSYPLVGELAPTSPFGQRRSYSGGPVSSYHAGQDFGAATGVPVYAPAKGVVVLAEPLAVRGQAVILDHGWGVFSGFWHLSQIDVTVGQEVDPGQVIGLVGNTGLSTGPHLHWEIQVRGVAVDPIQWTKESFPELESEGDERPEN